jgi:hypothetical protein
VVGKRERTDLTRKRLGMITALRSYAADAEVLGTVRQIAFSEDGDLVIAGLTLKEAGDILDALAAGGVYAVRSAAGAKVPWGAPPSTRPGEDVGDGNPVPGGVPVREAPQASPQASKGTEGQLLKHGSLPSWLAIPEELAGTKRIKDIVVWLLENGIEKDQDILVAECKKLGSKIPFITHVTNLEERVERALSVLED